MPIRIGSRRPRRPLHQEPAAVRQAREARKMTQAALAKRARVSPGYMSEIESGQRNAPPKTLGRIAAALKIDVAMLERRRPLQCPEDGCPFRFDPQENNLVPLHPVEGSEDQWCPGGLQRVHPATQPQVRAAA